MTARKGLALLCIAAPALLALQYVVSFGVPVPYWDEWTYLDETLRPALEHGVTLSMLFRFHNDHWIVIPRALMLLLDSATGFDTRAEMLLSWGAMVATLALLLRRFRHDWLLFIPIAVLLFTLRQHENQLWGWQVQIVLCAFFAVLCFELLLRPSRAAFAGGLLAALGATWSFAAGLAVWPVLLIQLWLEPRARRRARVAALVAAAVFIAFALLYRKPPQTPSMLAAARDPVDALVFLIAAFGSPFSWYLGVCVGAAPIVLAALVFALRRAPRAPSLPLSLLLFALGAIAILALGRAGYGSSQAIASKYVTFTLYASVGAYWLLLDLPASEARTALAAALCAAVVMGLDGDLTGWSVGRHAAAVRAEAGDLLAREPHPTDRQIEPLMDQPDVVRRNVPFLRARRLSFFKYEAGP